MVTCKLNYIERLEDTDGNLVKDIVVDYDNQPATISQILNTKHVDIAKKVLSFTDFPLKTYSRTKTDGTRMQKFLILPFGEDKFNKSRRKEVYKYLDNINKQEGKKYVGVKKVLLGTQEHDAIFIDVRPLIDDLNINIDFDIRTEDYLMDDTFYEIYNKTLFENQQYKEAETLEEYVVENSDEFFKIITNIKGKIQTYLQNPPEFLSRNSEDFNKKMYQLLRLLSNPTEINKIVANDKFIKEAINFAGDSYNKMNKGNDEYLSLKQDFNDIVTESGRLSLEEGLKFKSKDKQQRLSELARKLEKIKNKLYLFNYIKEFQRGLMEAGLNDSVFEIYNPFKYEAKLRDLLVTSNIEESQINTFIANSLGYAYESTNDLKQATQIGLNELSITMPADFFDDIRYESKTEYQYITNADGSRTVIKKDKLTLSESVNQAVLNLEKTIKDTQSLALDISAATIYPHYASVWRANATPFEKSFQKTYTEFRNTILVSEEDPSLTNLLLAAGEDQDDELLFATARTLFDRLREKDFQSFQNGQESFKSLKTILGDKSIVSSERRQLEQQMIGTVYEIPEEMQVVKLTENPDGSFTESKQVKNDLGEVETQTINYQPAKEVFDSKGKKIHVRLDNGDWIVKTHSFSGDTWVKTVETKALIHEYNYNKDIAGRVFSTSLESQTRDILNKWQELSAQGLDEINRALALLEYLQTSKYNDVLGKALSREIAQVQYNRHDFNSLLNRDSIMSLLWSGFYSYHEVPQSDEISWKAIDELPSGGFKKTREISKWLYNNSYGRNIEDKVKGNNPYSNLEYTLEYSKDNLIINRAGEVLLEKTDGSLIFTSFTKRDERYVFSGVAYDEISRFYMKNKRLKKANPENNSQTVEEITHQQRLSSNPKYKEYYDFLKNKHDTFNDKLAVGKLENYKLPQIAKAATKTLKEKLFNGKENLKSASNYIDSFVDSPNEVTLRNANGEFIDENGNVITEPITFNYNKQDLDGYDTKKLTPKFTKRLSNQDNVDDDLFISFMTFEDSVATYEALFDLEPQMKFLKLITKGNVNQQGELDLFGGRLTEKGKKKSNKFADYQKASATKTALALEQMINHYIYGDEKVKEEWLGKLDSHKIARVLKGINAFQVLAFNWVAAFTNLEVGVFNNYSAAVGQKFGLSSATLTRAYKTYTLLAPQSVSSTFKSNSLYERDHLTQLAVVFDAIKGNQVKVRDKFTSESLTERLFSKETLFLSSSIPEHANQLPLMIAFMMTYKISETSNFTMWDAYQKGSKDKVTINFQDEFGADLDIEVVNDFMRKLDVINSEAHGNYGKYQTAMAERYSYGGMFLQFGRWIYPSMKARFGSNKFSLKTGEYVDRGYTRWYLKNMVADVSSQYKVNWNMDEDISINLSREYKNILKKAGVTVAQGALNLTVKQATFILDRLTFGKLGQSIETINKWLYGDKTDLNKLVEQEDLKKVDGETDVDFDARVLQTFENRKLALIRASWELTVATLGIMIGMLLAASQDDDDNKDKDKAIQFLEIQARRFVSDIGLFTPTLNPLTPWDFFLRKLKDPFAVTRQIENNAGLLTQLLGFNFTEDGINFKFNDVYEKSGSGYQKGEYKIERKFMRSVLSPVYQIYRLMNPTELENSLQLLNKNSVFSNTD